MMCEPTILHASPIIVECPCGYKTKVKDLATAEKKIERHMFAFGQRRRKEPVE